VAPDLLSSWKEIAIYLGKGVRTAQRWESELGLPVRRPNASNRHVVVALRSELDQWLAQDFATRGMQRMMPETNSASGTFPYRVLVVDDDAEFRDTMKAMLESKGYEVLVAEDGFAGLATLKQALPDIIISDLRMPNMNGFEFLGIVRYRFPRLPAIAVSGEYIGVGVPESVLADAYFEKGSYSPSDLFSKITALLDVLPPRPREGKPCKAPLWIPNPKTGQYVVVTCPDCLRTFPAIQTKELKLGAYRARCDYCTTDVCFEITEETVQLNKAVGRSSAPAKQ
jgi:CheY-like chemotaxis protein